MKSISQFHRGRVPLLAALTLVSTACFHPPIYKTPPAVQTPTAYKEQPPAGWKTATPSDSLLKGNWWEVFGDPQLNRLEQMVSVSNQSVKAAEARFREARAVIRVNRAGYFPSIGTGPGITSSYGGGGSKRTTTSTGGTTATTTAGSTSNFFSIPFTATWEPDFWGRIGLSVQNAIFNAQASEADLENMRLSLQAELATDYFELHAQDMQEKLLTDTLDAYQRALQLTVNRFNGGVASKADVDQAQTQLESTRTILIDIGVTRAQFEHAIAVLTGQPPANLTLANGEIPGPPPPIPTGVPSQLLERRPDIAANERTVAAANASVGIARAAFYPSLTLNASAGLQSSSFINLFSWPSRFWSVGPGLSQTLFDFGRRRGLTEQAEATYDEDVANYRQTVLSAFQDVEDNLSALRLLEQEATQQDIAVRSATESLRLETDRYKAGTVSYLDVITSQTIELTNRRTAVGILERRMVSAVALIRSLGGGWDATALPSADALRSQAASKP